MNYYTKIEKASAILEKIKLLDATIIKVEKQAELISESDEEIQFSLSIPLKKEEETQCEHDSFNIMDMYSLMFEHRGVVNRGIKTPNNSKSELSIQIDSYEAMHVLGGVILALNTRRNGLIDELHNLLPHQN